MHRVNRVFWLINFYLKSFFCFKINGSLVFLAPQLLIIGFRRIHFTGRALIFPLSRFEIFSNGSLVLGCDVQIGQFCHITCSESIIIGNSVAIAGCVVITDISHGVGPVDVPPLKRKWKVKPVVIEDNCFIGWGAVILPGTHLSKGCVVGANAKVSGFHKAGTIIR